MPKFLGFVTVGNPNGEILLEPTSGGTNVVPDNQLFRLCETQERYVTGTIINTSASEVFVFFRGFGGVSLTTERLQGYQAIKFKNLQAEFVGFTVSASDIIVRLFIEKWELSTLDKINPFYNFPDVKYEVYTLSPVTSSGGAGFNAFTRTTISSIQTTTQIAAPSSSGLTLSVFQINITAAAANIVDLKFTNLGGTNARYIAKIDFEGPGTYTLRLDGLMNPNGINGVLQAETSTNASTVFDVIYAEIRGTI